MLGLVSQTVPGTGECCATAIAMLCYCHAITFATPWLAHAVKTNNPIGYSMVGTITLKAWSVCLPFNPFMYIVKQTGGTWTPVWKSLKICDSQCYSLYKYIWLCCMFGSEWTLMIEFSNTMIWVSLLIAALSLLDTAAWIHRQAYSLLLTAWSEGTI